MAFYCDGQFYPNMLQDVVTHGHRNLSCGINYQAVVPASTFS